MFFSIRYKILLLAICSTLFAAVAVFLLSVKEHEVLYRQSVEENLEALSSNLAEDLVQSMSAGHDLISITTRLLDLDRYRHIKYANVFDSNWELLQQYIHPEYLNQSDFSPVTDAQRLRQLPQTVSEVGDELIAIKIIGEPGFELGYMQIAFAFSAPLQSSRRSLLRNIMPWTSFALLMAWLVSYVLSTHLTKPLIQLSRFTQKVKRTNDYELRFRAMGSDEVSHLGNDINRMLDTIHTEHSTNRRQTQRLVQQQESMQKLANYDALTGLPNRTFFMDLLKLELARSKRLDQDLAILFFDIDGFKEINDQLGHETGDILLQAVGQRVGECLRDGDVLSRLGGDEFLIMVPNLHDPLVAQNISSRILKSFEDSFSINGWDVNVGVSIGAAHAKDANFSLEEFIRRADVAMYVSKAKGKGICTEFHKDMLLEMRRRLDISNRIHQAIIGNEFDIYYQLKIASGGQVHGVEALLRWENDALGSISPMEFIPIAEQGGKIEEITAWVVKRVFSELRELQKICGKDAVVSLNLSSQDLQNESFIDYVVSEMSVHDIDVTHIQFEMTESSYLENFESANSFFNQIHDMGGSVALDDFGTGYSSLSYLTKIKIDTLKIDRAFVSKLGESDRDDLILQMILDLCLKIGLDICSEGVETAEQARFLLTHGSHHLQGYYFAKPVPIAELAAAVSHAERKYFELNLSPLPSSDRQSINARLPH